MSINSYKTTVPRISKYTNKPQAKLHTLHVLNTIDSCQQITWTDFPFLALSIKLDLQPQQDLT